MYDSAPTPHLGLSKRGEQLGRPGTFKSVEHESMRLTTGIALSRGIFWPKLTFIGYQSLLQGLPLGCQPDKVSMVARWRGFNDDPARLDET
jgi:hypothetical protein